MTRQYYSARTSPKELTLVGLCQKLIRLYLLFKDRDYFKGEAGITGSEVPEEIQHKAALALEFDPFPIDDWPDTKITEDNIFDTLEFLYDHVAKPGEWTGMTSDTGWNYYDYDGYDKAVGQAEFRAQANAFLARYRGGYELSVDGEVLSLGTDGVPYILKAEVPLVGDANVDAKVHDAIRKWRNRHLSLSDKKQAIRDLADVFEWLKKSERLKAVLVRRDESVLFDIANNFAIRHHNPSQRQDYDENIWYSWMFHFYLATYHAVVRMLKKEQGGANKSVD